MLAALQRSFAVRHGTLGLGWLRELDVDRQGRLRGRAWVRWRSLRAWRHGIRQTLEGSFSAVSKPNFASKYAFESSRRDLHNALLCTAPKSHFFQKISRICQNLRKFSEILRNSQFFKPIFCENFEIAAVHKDANLVELEKCCQTHIFLQISFRYSRERARQKSKSHYLSNEKTKQQAASYSCTSSCQVKNPCLLELSYGIEV